MPHGAPYLWLQPHVHLCVTPTAIVFLDVRRDSYRSLPLKYLPAVAAVVHGRFPVIGTSNCGSDSCCSSASQLADRLVRLDLVTADESSGKPAWTPLAVPPVEAAAVYTPGPHAGLSARDVAKFLRACASAHLLLARGLEAVVFRIARRNEKVDSPVTIDLPMAEEAAFKFRRLRIWFFKADGYCLFHSIALIEFLFLFRLHPRLVLGVRTDHWAAHSWVQFGEHVLDSSPERARFYTPILAV